jgi:O-antigen ligase
MRKIIGTAHEVGTGLLERGPYYLFAALIIYGPFHYGLNTPAGQTFFTQVAYLAFFLFLWNSVIKEEWPKIPLLPLACFGLILIHGWWMAFNANSYYRWHEELVTIRILGAAPLPNLPGSYERFASTHAMAQITGLFGLILIFFNLPTHQKHRLLLILVLSITGCAFMGIAMKFSESLKELYWPLERYGRADVIKDVFAGFRYHAHAASLMVFGLCLAGGLWVHALATGTARREQSITGGTFFIILFGLVINTSRAGWVMALLALLALATLASYWSARTKSVTKTNALLIAITITLVTSIFVTVFAAERDRRAERIMKLTDDLGRRAPTHILNQMVKDTPILGFGPASFPYVFPKYQLRNAKPDQDSRFLNAAHHDYYQYFFEWGPLGTVAFLAILFTPFWFAVSSFYRLRWRGLMNPIPYAGLVACALTALHATKDFPLQILQLQLCYLLCWAATIDTRYIELPHASNNNEDSGGEERVAASAEG